MYKIKMRTYYIYIYLFYANNNTDFIKAHVFHVLKKCVRVY